MADNEEVVAKIVFDVGKDQIIGKLKDGPDKIKEAAKVAAQRSAPRVENYMKTNAPWTDRTANARNGLAARAYEDGDEVGIILYHQVDYGIYLETRWGAKYAIINPTIEAMTDEVMQNFDRIMERI